MPFNILKGFTIKKINVQKALSRGRDSKVFNGQMICPVTGKILRECSIKVCQPDKISAVTYDLIQKFHPHVENIYGIRIIEPVCQKPIAVTFCHLLERNFCSYCPLKDPPIKVLARDLLDGLSFLHSRGIAHCDIKSNNIMFNSSKHLVIIDLNNAQYEKDFGQYPLATTLEERHIDLFFNCKDWDFRVDMWAVATILYYLTTRSIFLKNLLACVRQELDYKAHLPTLPIELKYPIYQELDIIMEQLFNGIDKFDATRQPCENFQIINFFLKTKRATPAALDDYTKSFLKK